MKAWWRRVRPIIASGLVYQFVRGVGRTLRIKPAGFDPDSDIGCGKILCSWHGRSFVGANHWRGKGYWVIISHSRDGEIQKTVFERLGFNIIRGSTGRGGVRAAVEGIRALKDKGVMAITPDGPRGPSGVVQGGVMLMAQKSGAALVPLGISGGPNIRVGSWDRYLLPLPFARGIVICGEPMYVAKDATEEEVESVRLKLESEMHRLAEEADLAVGAKPLRA